MVAIESFCDSDFWEVAEFLGRLWHDEHSSEQAHWCGADELCWHLACSQASFVARSDAGVFQGIALVRSDFSFKDEHWIAKGNEIKAAALADGYDSTIDNIYANDEDAILAEAAQQEGIEHTGELVLLALEDSARGQGLGARLLNCALLWLQQQGCSTFRLVTDDACDISFYDHLGIGQLMKRQSSSGEDFDIYVYQTSVADVLKRLG
ncbi:MAG: GNAT family N-acetyltransferase [Atopobiaceae bacterium]|nr:GNAT family N-acetyltransferase [Atopobiaceae bacterium]